MSASAELLVFGMFWTVLWYGAADNTVSQTIWTIRLSTDSTVAMHVITAWMRPAVSHISVVNYPISNYANFHSEHGNLTKIGIFLKMADVCHIENRIWLYLSPYWPSNANFGKEMKNHMQISVTWPKLKFLQIQDGGRPPFWKYLNYLSRELSDFDQIWFTDANFHSEDGYLTKIEIFQIQDGGRTPYWKSFFLLYLGASLAD